MVQSDNATEPWGDQALVEGVLAAELGVLGGEGRALRRGAAGLGHERDHFGAELIVLLLQLVQVAVGLLQVVLLPPAQRLQSERC